MEKVGFIHLSPYCSIKYQMILDLCNIYKLCSDITEMSAKTIDKIMHVIESLIQFVEVHFVDLSSPYG